MTTLQKKKAPSKRKQMRDELREDVKSLVSYIDTRQYRDAAVIADKIAQDLRHVT